jgi:hypothetical protein
MQRQTPEGIVLACDFCHRDWDGQEPMIEGHHGHILCLECLKVALAQCAPVPDAKYACTMCLRYNIPGTLAQWRNPAHPEAVVCRDCIVQSAGTFSKSRHTDWQWDRKIAN